jgi:hypothetical protein
MKNKVWFELLLFAVLFSVISLKDQLPNNNLYRIVDYD